MRETVGGQIKAKALKTAVTQFSEVSDKRSTLMNRLKPNPTRSSIWTRLWNMERSRILFLLVFCLPTFALYFVFCIYPIFDSIVTSFFDWSGFASREYVGWENYRRILNDPVFFKAVKNDFYYVLGKEILIVPLTILFAISLTRLRLKKVEVSAYRFIFYIPNILSTIIIGIMWTFVYDPFCGLLNGLLDILNLSHLSPIEGWMVTNPMECIIVVASWCGIGLYMLILISAINSVPKEIYEAANMDGADEWKQLWKITIPATWGQIKFVITSIIFQTLGNYGLVLAMNGGGGVDGNSMVMGLYVFNHGIDSTVPQVGYANAAAVLLMIISGSVTLIVNGLLSRKEKD